MAAWRIRDLHHEDLDDVLRLWTTERATHGEPVYALSEVLASCTKDHALVAVRDGRVIGAAVGRAAHDQGWVVFLATHDDPGGAGPDVAADLLSALEASMSTTGLSKLSVLLPPSDGYDASFLAQGFEEKQHLRYLERSFPVQDKERGVLTALGGRLLPRDLWHKIGGMQQEKHLLEQRLILPLARPDVAERYGVVPPRSVMLFGPPGTGKTTFAKAIASRLEWPFVEIFPSRLAAEPGGLAGALRGAFEQVAELEHAVVFIDEVEEIAARRGSQPPSPLQGVTNELLKIIPAFRDQPGRLLVCATNFIRALDDAFLRHGRFDYVIPIGLPDDAARAAIWRGYLPPAARDRVELADLVEASAGFSPADIEYAARRASQSALESVLGPDGTPDEEGPSTKDYLTAISDTRATVSRQSALEFSEDIERIARL